MTKSDAIQKQTSGKPSTQTSKVMEAIAFPKIKEGDKEAFVKFLALVSTLIGVPSPKDSAEKAVIFDYMVQYMGGLTYEEVLLAVKLNLSGEYGEIIEAYNLLSVQYLAKVVDKYRDHRQQEIRRFKAKLPAPEEKKVSNEDLYNSLIALHKKLGEFPYTFPYGRVYKHLEAKINLSDDQKKRIFAEEKAKFTHRATKDEILVKVYERIVKGYIRNTHNLPPKSGETN